MRSSLIASAAAVKWSMVGIRTLFSFVPNYFTWRILDLTNVQHAFLVFFVTFRSQVTESIELEDADYAVGAQSVQVFQVNGSSSSSGRMRGHH